MQLAYETVSEVAVVKIDHPPVNALSTGVPEGIARAVEAAQDDAGVRAVVVIGAGRTFAAGADIHEFVRWVRGQGPWPVFHRWFDLIEASEKPVIMAIHGQALGAGLELAMAGHYRVAMADAQLGQPEVKIGLIPGAAGTVRLPRLVGAVKAAEMCAFGEALHGGQALEAGLVDKVVPVGEDLLAAAIEFAREQAEVQRTRDLEVRDREELAESKASELRERCKKTRRNLEAPLAAIEAVEKAAWLDFEEGVKAEAEIFRRCLASTQSKALIHAFFAERAAAKVPGIGKDVVAREIRKVGVIGAGTMGGGIAMALANAGIEVRLKDVDQAGLERGLAVIQRNYDRNVSSGRFSVEQAEERLTRIHGLHDDVGLGDVDLIIEAVFESLELKKRVFEEMGRVAGRECLLASNTSTLDIDELARVTTRPDRVLGLHFFSPANVMRLLEIVRAKETSDEAIATGLALAKAMKKVGVVVGNAFGFVGNRIVIPYMDQAQFLVEEGATPEQVDRVMTEFGMAMGPLAVADLSGIDVFWRIHEERKKSGAVHGRETLGVPVLYAVGRYGQKTGAGWFRYGEERRAMPDDEVAQMVWRAAREKGIAQREISDDEIRDRCVFALVNEGARVLEEGVAARASDIDVVYLTGYGFPAWRGGPMFYADTVGLAKVVERVRGFGWTAAPLLERLAREGGRFTE